MTSFPRDFAYYIVKPGGALGYRMVSPSGMVIDLTEQAGLIVSMLIASYSRPVPHEAIVKAMYPLYRPHNAEGNLRSCLWAARRKMARHGVTFDVFGEMTEGGAALIMNNLQEEPRGLPEKRRSGPGRPTKASQERAPDAPWTFPHRVERFQRKAP